MCSNARANGKVEKLYRVIDNAINSSVPGLLELESKKEVALTVAYMLIRKMDFPPNTTEDIAAEWGKVLETHNVNLKDNLS